MSRKNFTLELKNMLFHPGMKTKPPKPGQAITELEKRFCRSLRNWYVKNRDKKTDSEGRKYTQVSVGKELGISQSELSKVLKEEKCPKEDWRRWVADYIGIPYEEMIGLPGKKPPPERPLIVHANNKDAQEYIDEHAEYYRGVPLYKEGRLAAGSGGLIINEHEEPESTVVIYQQELLGRSRHDLRALRVGGDSMWPVIPKNSIVVVDISDREFVDGKIYAVREPETDPPIATIKRIRKGEKGFVLIPENRAELPNMVDLDWYELVIGRVVWMWRDLLEESRPQKS